MSRVLSFYIEETGVVKSFAGGVAPSGYLMCFGQAVSRTDFAGLFDVIGTAFGVGDGTTTFNVPDCRGRIDAGVDTMGGTAASRLTAAGGVDGSVRGAVGGTETHALTTAQMPAHTHPNTLSDPGHLHAFNHAFGNTAGGSGSGQAVVSAAGSTSTNASNISITNASQGSGTAHPNVQPTIVFNKIIKT